MVKDVMGRIIVPELLTIKEYLPKTYQQIKEAGKVDIVLAIDNTSRSNFAGQSLKLEQAVIKIVLPGIDSAQQSPCLAIPIFFMEGDETYVSLQKVLGSMLNESLTKQVHVPIEGAESTALEVTWHLCSDHKLVALLGGFGGSGCNRPCFICNWDRSDPHKACELRTEEDIALKAAWAQEFLKPIHDAQTKLKVASKKLNDAKKSRKGHGHASPADVHAVDAARAERDTAFKEVGEKLKADPTHELAVMLNKPQRLQSRVASMAGRHLKRPDAEHFRGIETDLTVIRQGVSTAEECLKSETQMLKILQAQSASYDEAVMGEEWLEAHTERIVSQEERVQEAEECLTGQLDLWAMEVDKVNALDGVVAKVEAEGNEEVVRVFHPNLQFTHIAKELLQGLLVEVCEGLYRGCMVEDFIPSSRWYLESLHLVINTGNSWIEVARNTFQYLLMPDGKTLRVRMEEHLAAPGRRASGAQRGLTSSVTSGMYSVGK
jgi:hypothetical protein